ncbi:MAG: flagellar biosynthesis protein FlhB [Myxococcota bacterium]|nr:flagellar biosynthesis protein FlhB [Myxococcota bacterium]
MPEYEQDQKTEEPTSKQRENFRKEGQVAKSQDLSSVVTIAAATGTLIVAWPLISSNLTGCTRQLLGRLESHSNGSAIAHIAGSSLLGAVLPIAITMMFMGIASQISQVGFNFTTKPLIPDISKFNPLPRLKQLFFSASAVTELVKSLLKVTIIGIFAVRVLMEELENHGRLSGLSTGDLLTRLAQIVIRIVLQVVIGLAIIAILDVLLERYRMHQKMKMTKEQVKEERKASDGNPIAKSRLRAKQREFARKRMLENLSSADVVVVNPTHYSVALKYNVAEDAAPRIIALGTDRFALEIRKRARNEGVVVVSNPPLARGLYAKGKVGAYIPNEFYNIVASLLAWVYNVTGRVA